MRNSINQDDQFSGSNTPHQNGYFLGGSISHKSGYQWFYERPITEDKDVKTRMKLVRASQDPYEAFKDDDYLYPIKEDDMSLLEKISSENLQGMPILPTGKCTLFCNMVCCFYFLVFGLVFIGIASNVAEYKIRYDTCQIGQLCKYTFEVTKSLSGPIFIYYELNEFYSSHIDFSQSIVPKQMQGQELSSEDVNTFCQGAQTYTELQRPNLFNQSSAGFVLDLSQVPNPCGVAAKYIFNDSFGLFDSSSNSNLYINFTSIAYNIDLKYKFQRNQNFAFRQWLDLADGTISKNILIKERIINWFNIQSLPQVRKLYGRYDGGLNVGNYTVTVMNNYPTTIFSGTKTVIVTTLSSFGSKNYSFGILLIVAASVQFFVGIFIFVRHKMLEKRELQEQRVHVDMKMKEKIN